MNDRFPEGEFVHVLKDDEPLGPFSVDELLEGLESGHFSYDDVCLREGAVETERLRDFLDWEELENDSPIEDEWDEDGEEEQDHTDAVPASRSLLYRGHRSIVSFPTAFLGLVGGIVGAIWLYPVGAAWSAACLAVAVLALGFLALARCTCEYTVRSGRVEQETGLFAKSSKEIRVSDIRAINVTCVGLKGLLGVGTVDFFTTGDDPEVRFTDVWAAKEVKKLVRALQDAS